MTELTQLLGPSQEREVPPLLGLEKVDLLELMPPSEVGGGQILGPKKGNGLISPIYLNIFWLSFIVSIKMKCVRGGQTQVNKKDITRKKVKAEILNLEINAVLLYTA